MAVKKILMAYDGSENGQKALQWAIDFAKQTSAEIAIVGVVDLGLSHWLLDEGVTTKTNHIFMENAEKMLGQAADKVIAAGVRAKVILLEGDPAAVIISTAEKEKMDIIICGSKGKGGLTKLVLGSIASKLVNYATVPVIVVK